MRESNVFTHIYGVVSLLGIGASVWIVKSASENDHLFYLSMLAFLLIIIAFLILNKVLDKLESKMDYIANLNKKVEILENDLNRQKNISDYLCGQLGHISAIARKSVNND